MATRGEPTATWLAVLGLPEGKQEAGTGRQARPGVGAAAAPGCMRLQDRYTRAGERRCMAPCARTPRVPRWLRVAGSCSTPGKSLAAVLCPKENVSSLQDAAQPCCAFSHHGCQPWHWGSWLERGLWGAPSRCDWLGFGLCFWDLGQRIGAKGENICGY